MENFWCQAHMTGVCQRTTMQHACPPERGRAHARSSHTAGATALPPGQLRFQEFTVSSVVINSFVHNVVPTTPLSLSFVIIHTGFHTIDGCGRWPWTGRKKFFQK